MPQSQATAARFKWPRWFDWAFRCWLTTILVLGVVKLGERLALDSGMLPAAGVHGAVWSLDAKRPSGWLLVEAVDPQGPMGRTGVVTGDIIRFDKTWQHLAIRHAGDTIGFTVNHQGRLSHRSYVVPVASGDAVSKAVTQLSLLNDLVSALSMAFGLVLLLKRWREKAATCLGLFFVGFSLSASVPQWIESQPLALFFVAMFVSGQLLAGIGPAFCHYLTDHAMTRRRAWLIWGMIALFASYTVVSAVHLVFLITPPPWINVVNGDNIPFLIETVLAIAILGYGYVRADEPGRNRTKLVATAFVLFVLGAAIAGLNPTNRAMVDPWVVPMRWLAGSLNVAAMALLVFTVLRHKLFDFSFAVNRALVYGFVSALILVGIGLAEWAAKKLVPDAWHDASKFYSAAIALVLFLLFHRIHHWVEHHVEHLFFRHWQANEAKLRQFIEAAAHYERQDSLMRDTVAEFRRFTGTEQVALFWRQDGEDYVRQHGELDMPVEQIDADDPAVARARVIRCPVSIDEAGSVLPASLLLPVIDHGQIVGLLALGAKPNSVGYRPDEVEVMAWAAQQAGLDLQSMRARGYESKISALEAQVERLSTILSARTANA